MKVSFKIQEIARTQTVETIYINAGMERVVLHYSNNENAAKLLEFSFVNKLEFYRDADDEHICITIPLNSIFKIEY